MTVPCPSVSFCACACVPPLARVWHAQTALLLLLLLLLLLSSLCVVCFLLWQARDCADSMCVYGAIVNYTLRTSKMSGEQQYEALKFVTHFVGDIHQVCCQWHLKLWRRWWAYQ
jgi:hypothetical protein